MKRTKSAGTNRRIASYMTFIISLSLILSCSSPVHAGIGNKLNVVEGSGKAPNVEVIRVDDNGNEIRVDDSSSSGDNENGSSDPDEMTYAEDVSGILSANDIYDKTTLYIENADDMKMLAKNCRLDTWSRDKYVILKNDIMLDGSDFKYIPIFSGVFDGQGHTISGISITNSGSYTGLFCITQESAVIKDLHVQGSNVASGEQLATGGIVGDNYGLISNCTFEGNVNGYDYTGGIAGYNEQTGVISSCKSSGYVVGMHFTGGITGYNMGTLNGCINDSKVNISSIDETISVQNFDIDKFSNNILNLFDPNTKKDYTSVLNSTVDVGGICGYSHGIITCCTNNSLVGYEHVGYNIGGIAGRQNGFIDMCVNNGEIYGRKDVGGIAGQAEPYVVIDITEDIVGQLTSNMNTLHDLVNVTLNDAGSESNLVTARLNMVKSFTDKALNDTSYLSTETENYINSIAEKGDEVLSRVEYAMNESTKSGGAFDKAKSSITEISSAADDLVNAVDDLDIHKYFSEEEEVSYNKAKDNIKQASDDYSKFHDENENKYYKDYYYGYINSNRPTSSNLVLLDGDGREIPWPDKKTVFSDTVSGNNSEYDNVARLAHKDSSTEPPAYTDFPSSDEAYREEDKLLDLSAEGSADAAISRISDEDFEKKYGTSFFDYEADNVEDMSGYIIAHADDMGEATGRDIRYAIDHTKRSIRDLGGTVSATKDIVSDLSSRPAITLPRLSDEYQARSGSLIANIQGMSDSLGLLNNEMNSSNQQLIDDMVKVNDQFNVIMILIADAIDGVLDQDYTDVYEDTSVSVARDCTDATIADSINYGSIYGDINSSGIAGTMAIEYDFDLESDITGIKDAAAGTTYRTKCVMRNDKNEGYVEGVKDHVGGICGFQEMGTILSCHNYGKLKSNSGDYIGGISGESLSTIMDCYTKGILVGDSYIGGIAGKGYDISGCISLPTIVSSESFLGAIAGDNSNTGRIKNNYFVSDDQAGIDRVSYSGKAEPVTYSELLAMDNIPSEFRSIKVRFVLDDKPIAVKDYEYDSSVSTLPVEISEGEYISWDWENSNLNDIRSDSELIGKTARYITTLGSMQLRDNIQSAVLVDGRFIEGDYFKSTVSGISTEENVIETWTLEIPDDVRNEHLVRYAPPAGVNPSDVRIWLLNGNDMEIAETTPMGRYLTFNTQGLDVRFMVENTYVNPLVRYAGYEAAALIIIAVIVIIAVISAKNRRRRKKTAANSHSGNRDYDSIDDIDDISDKESDV